MRAVLPGKPRATPQAFHTVSWRQHRILVYVTRQSLVILNGDKQILQTIHHDGPDELDAVRIDGYSGKIATASREQINIFAPLDQDVFSPKWSLEYSFHVANSATEGDFLHTLSWGQEDELLIGSSHLQIYEIAERERRFWLTDLSNPIQQALFSPSAELIASRARYDRLVKVWRRRSFGSAFAQFDYGYLNHADAVTGIQWRDDSTTGEDEHHQTLFTICQDGKLRIWSAKDLHNIQMLQLWSSIDLVASIQPRRLSNQSLSTVRYCVFLTRHDFSASVDNAANQIQDPQRRPFLEHLQDLAAQTPDVCLVVDNQGHMSAWGLFNVGSKDASHSDILNLAHLERFPLLQSHRDVDEDSSPIVLGFSESPLGQKISLVVHDMVGSITWFSGDIDALLAPSTPNQRLWTDAKLTGHQHQISSIETGHETQSVTVWSNQGEVIQWVQKAESSGFLDMSHVYSKESVIQSVHILSEGQVLFVYEKELHLHGSKSQSSDYHILKHGLEKEILWAAMESGTSSSSESIALVTAAGVEYLDVPKTQSTTIATIEDAQTRTKFDELVHLAVLSPRHERRTAGKLITLSRNGQLQVRDQETAQIITGTRPIYTGVIDASDLQLSDSDRAVVLDRTRTSLMLVDLKRYAVEYRTSFEAYQVISALCWQTLKSGRDVLAVAFEHDIQIMAEAPYDFTGKTLSWQVACKVSIKGLTEYAVSSVSWIGDNDLVIAAGNQVYVSETDIPPKTRFDGGLFSNDKLTLQDLSEIVNADLPIYHPQSLHRLVCDGYFDVAVKTIASLHKRLKFYTEGDGLHDQIMTDLALFPGASHSNGDVRADEEHDQPELIVSYLDSLIVSLNENHLPLLHPHNATKLPLFVRAVARTEKLAKSVDAAGIEFLYRLFLWEEEAGTEQSLPAFPSEFVALGSQSSSLDVLVKQISSTCSEKILWNDASRTGMFLWLRDIEAVREHFEAMARNEFNFDEDRDPTRVSLYYTALRKKTVLLGLWRMAIGNKERAATQKFLANDFNEPRWRTAALKNAYALLGKRRYEYAASFFLFADRLEDAVNVCVNEMHDLQLAIAITRVYAGDDTPVLKQIFHDQVLPYAARNDDRFLASWAQTMLGRPGLAMSATTKAGQYHVPTPETPTSEAQSYQGNKPDLLRLYQHLRQAQLNASFLFKGNSEMPQLHEECEIVKNTLRMYDRMRMPVLALLLAKKWEFLDRTHYSIPKGLSLSQSHDKTNGEVNGFAHGDGDGCQSEREDTNKVDAYRPPPPKEAFQDASSSIFDAFDF